MYYSWYHCLSCSEWSIGCWQVSYRVFVLFAWTGSSCVKWWVHIWKSPSLATSLIIPSMTFLTSSTTTTCEKLVSRLVETCLQARRNLAVFTSVPEKYMFIFDIMMTDLGRNLEDRLFFMCRKLILMKSVYICRYLHIVSYLRIIHYNYWYNTFILGRSKIDRYPTHRGNFRCRERGSLKFV